ncbi:MAG TPA: sugar phosphate nucleotidyltransferase, partial [Candidatus Atribacteria bacterium]|nr:sugar phosphate nucleotidyltransferase [Candidatus Atribacteria bacterium]
YNPLFSYHQERDADVTLVATRVDRKDAPRFGIMEVDEDGWITGFEEKPLVPRTDIAFMGIYVFRVEFLAEKLIDNAREGKFDLVRNVIIENVGKAKMQAYFYNDPWFDVGTVQAYWEANMHLLEPLPVFNLYNPDWMIFTNRGHHPPTHTWEKVDISSSIIGEGAVIKGKVSHSVIFPGVVLEEGTEVVDSIIFNDTVVEEKAKISLSILDKNIVVGREAIVGWGDDLTPNVARPDLLNWGVSLVGKGSVIPAGTVIHRNCLVGIGIKEEHFGGKRELKSGEVLI